MIRVSAERGMVASSQRLASDVGVELLKLGGSAVDAAIGVNAMLSLIEPYMCGPGGDLFAMVWDPANRQLAGLNASGRAPRAQSLQQLQQSLGGARAIPHIGPNAVTVPGAVAGWASLHQRYGRLPLAELFAPAIEHAKRGVEIGPVTATWWSNSAALVASGEHVELGFNDCFLIDGMAPAAGSRFQNHALARTYARLAEHGLDDFYSGGIAADLTAFVGRCGVNIGDDDLRRCRAEWVAPITTRYRGYDIYELPPNGQGLCVLQMLNILEQFPLADYGYHSVDYWHTLIEAKKLAFEDRACYYADPDFSQLPVAQLASKSYAASRVQLIGEAANQSPDPGDPELGHSDTTYLSVADENGMMVSLIQSIYSGFGSGITPPELGFSLQSRGAGFSLRPDHPNVYAPGKRPFHTIIPAFVMRDGQPWSSFGVMGADMQPQGQVQVLVNQLDFGLDLQAAGDAPRLRHDGLNNPNLSATSDGGIVWYEAQFDQALVDGLAARGHDMRLATHPVQHFMGGYQAVQRHSHGYYGASESRFDGKASGY